MDALSDLKHILHSKRANIYYLEKCRVLQKSGRVVYLTEEKKNKQYWNIPIANTSVLLLGACPRIENLLQKSWICAISRFFSSNRVTILLKKAKNRPKSSSPSLRFLFSDKLLGTGTSITQAAVRMLCSAGVLFGFSGGGGTPLLTTNEIEWMTPQSEYRPTEYIQAWMKFWFDSNKRLKVAKTFQKKRITYLQKTWAKDQDLKIQGFDIKDEALNQALTKFNDKIDQYKDTTNLLLLEAQLTKTLYKFAATHTKHKGFKRQHDSIDAANAFLNHGNYLAYGLAATTLWVLGIPHGFAGLLFAFFFFLKTHLEFVLKPVFSKY